MQLCQGPLEKLVKDRGVYGNIESDKEVLLQIIQGVKWLSDNKVAYRSLNPFNILVSFAKGETPPRIKLGDFFMSRMQKSDRNAITNSGNNRNPNWSAPEILKNQPYTLKADVFALGLVFIYFLSNGTHPYGSSNQIIQIISNKAPTMPPEITDPNAIDLISRMLQTKPENRTSIDKTECHPFFWSADKSLAFIVASKKVLEDLSKQQDPISTRDIEANKNLLFKDSWVDQLSDIVKQELQGRYGPKGDQKKYVYHLIITIRNLVITCNKSSA
jgi:serine/threonine protein kinase